MPTDIEISGQALDDLRWLLTRIGSWTNATWVQQLRYQFGDERANALRDAIGGSLMDWDRCRGRR